jgi:anti-anti-sigma regulatory factor
MEASFSGRTPADRSASSCPDWHRPGPDTEPFEHPHGLDSVITLRVGHPYSLVEAVDMQEKVKALIARRPAAIVLDMTGVMPTDEMGMLMLSAMARDAAEDGITVALADPSPPLLARLAQLGVRNFTFINSPVPPAPTEDEHGQETGRLPASLPLTGSEGTTRLTGSGLPPVHAGAGIHEEGLLISVCPFCSTS